MRLYDRYNVHQGTLPPLKPCRRGVLIAPLRRLLVGKVRVTFATLLLPDSRLDPPVAAAGLRNLTHIDIPASLSIVLEKILTSQVQNYVESITSCQIMS
ncbi:hypothetical protein Trydic_g1830 [Trypoxylus dichotomus]